MSVGAGPEAPQTPGKIPPLDEILVSRKPLFTVLSALLDASGTQIRELRAISNLPGHMCPIKQLQEEYNAAVRAHKELHQ